MKRLGKIAAGLLLLVLTLSMTACINRAGNYVPDKITGKEGGEELTISFDDLETEQESELGKKLRISALFVSLMKIEVTKDEFIISFDAEAIDMHGYKIGYTMDGKNVVFNYEEGNADHDNLKKDKTAVRFDGNKLIMSSESAELQMEITYIKA